MSDAVFYKGASTPESEVGRAFEIVIETESSETTRGQDAQTTLRRLLYVDSYDY
jgi:hypothetical protein